MSRINVDKITGATGTASGAPITLSGDTATLGSGVAMAANHSGVKTALNASGTAPIYACRAWVNFDGDSGSGTGSSDITINGSGNVLSITDRGTGRYTVTFSTAMPDANYSTIVTPQKEIISADDGYVMGGVGTGGQNSSSVQLTFQQGGAGPDDVEQVCVAIFR